MPRITALVPLLALVALPAGSIRAQPVSRIDRDRASVMVEQARKDIERHYYDSTYGGVDLAARFSLAEQGIQRATSLGELFGHIAAAVAELDDSHTFFLPPQQTVRADYGWEMQMIGDSCFVTRVKPGSDAAAKGLREGDGLVTVNGLAPTRENMWKLVYLFHLLQPRGSLGVVVRSPGGELRELTLTAKARPSKRVIDLTGSDGGHDIWTLINEANADAYEDRPRYVELGPDVLLWKLNGFDSFDRSVDEGIKRARKAGTVILDLRGNSGGHEKALLSLIGAISDGDVAVGTRRERTRSTPIVAKGHGDKAFNGRLIILVDSESASASEIIARTVQLGNRGIVVGDRTAGAVMLGRSFSHLIGAGSVVAYAVSVTIADVVMQDGGRLEATGVTPDHLVIPTGADLAAGLDPALSRAAELAGVALTPAQAGALLRKR